VWSLTIKSSVKNTPKPIKNLRQSIHRRRKWADLTFKDEMEKVSRKRVSNIVLALDFPFEKPERRQTLLGKAQNVMDAACPYICAVKFNHHLVLPLGIFNGIQSLINTAHKHGVPTIMDCKANDIGSTNTVLAQYYYSAGFDALIANPFIGWEEGLKPIFDVASQNHRGVILLVYMSHKGAAEGYGQTIVDRERGAKMPQYISFAKKAKKYEADGAVVGATYPEKIKEVRRILGKKVPIYSPGVGAQGATVETAVEAGARYVIVGREITLSADPAETARKIRNIASSIK